MEDLYRKLVDSVRDYAIFALDPIGRVVTWNVGAEHLKGYRDAEIIGQHFSIFYPREDVASGKCEFELDHAARDGRFEDEGWRLRKDGSRFWANVIISPVRGAAGELLGYAKVTRDLTERRQNEEARTALVAAQRANETKDAFLATLGHELRNPLAPITTAIELLRARGGPPSRELDIIERQARQLIRLVDDLLDVSRIGQGKIELVKRRLDLREAIAQAVESAAPLIESKRHRLVLEAMPQPIAVDGDPVRLIQIFANLLNNAAKYMEPGGRIELTVATTGDTVEITVRDTGVGIDGEFLPHLFETFSQAPEDQQRRAGGLGLGLNLVRSLVDLHGGSVHAASGGRGQGSVFTVRLPLAR